MKDLDSQQSSKALYVLTAFITVLLALPYIVSWTLQKLHIFEVVHYDEKLLKIGAVISIVTVIILYIVRKRTRLVGLLVIVLLLMNIVLLQAFTAVSKNSVVIRDANPFQSTSIPLEKIEQVWITPNAKTVLDKYPNVPKVDVTATNIQPHLLVLLREEQVHLDNLSLKQVARLKQFFIEQQIETVIEPIPEKYQSYYFDMKDGEQNNIIRIFELNDSFPETETFETTLTFPQKQIRYND